MANLLSNVWGTLHTNTSTIIYVELKARFAGICHRVVEYAPVIRIAVYFHSVPSSIVNYVTVDFSACPAIGYYSITGGTTD